MKVLKKEVEYDWAKVLKTPYADIDTVFMEELVDAADNWEICACGNLCDDIPRNLGGAPIDADLESLGHRFHQEVSSMSYYHQESHETKFNLYQNNARNVHNKIEKRAIEILKELQNESV